MFDKKTRNRSIDNVNDIARMRSQLYRLQEEHNALLEYLQVEVIRVPATTGYCKIVEEPRGETGE